MPFLRTSNTRHSVQRYRPCKANGGLRFANAQFRLLKCLKLKTTLLRWPQGRRKA